MLVTTKPDHRHLPHLDGWRGIAILMVIASHFAGLRSGDMGVQVFFVLSGMLMSQVLFVDKTRLSTFYKRRIARVFPVFYLYLSTIAIGSWILTPTRPLGELVYTATFLRTYFPYSIWNETLPTGHIWSLNVEEHSYVLLSMIALWAGLRGVRIARIALPVATLGCLAAYVAYSVWRPGDLESPAKLRSECAAFALLLSASLHLWLRRPTRALFWVALCTTASVYVFTSVSNVAHNPLNLIVLPAALALLINVLRAAPKIFLDALSARWLTWFGVISFSLYIWQQLFLWLAMHGKISLGCGAVFALVAGVCSYYAFERPMRRSIRNLGIPRPLASPS